MLAQKDAYNTTKDSCDVEGLDTTMGYSAWVGSKAKNDGVMIASCKQTPSNWTPLSDLSLQYELQEQFHS